MKIVLGGPGCGKTTRLLQITDDELSSGVSPKEIAFVAFTRKAAHEALARAKDKFGLTDDDLPYFRTLHSLAFKQLGLNSNSVMSHEDYSMIGKSLRLEFGGQDEDFGMPVGTTKGDKVSYLEQMSRLMGIDIKEACARFRLDVDAWEVQLYADTLRAYKRARKALDFTDMLERYVSGEGDNPSLRVVIVDEAQDLSPLQWKVVRRITAGAERVYIAGDDDQAIYEWSGADVATFLGLQGDIEVLPLSHRLPRVIFDKANEILGRIRKRYEKKWNPASEGGRIDHYSAVGQVDFSQGTWLLLARNRYMLSDYIDVLRRSGFPYLHNGKTSTASETVHALLLWERIRRGEACKADEVKKLYGKLRQGGVHSKHKGFPSAKSDLLYTHEELVRDHGLLVTKEEDWMTAVRMSEKDREYYRAILRRKESLLKVPRISVSTIHQVKGGEADHVCLRTDMSYSCYRSLHENPDSEHRVFYVGATRAKQSLHIIHPQSNKSYRI